MARDLPLPHAEMASGDTNSEGNDLKKKLLYVNFPAIDYEGVGLRYVDDELFEMMEPLRTALEKAMNEARTLGHRMTESVDSFVSAHATCEYCGATLRVGYSVANPRSDPIVLDGATSLEQCKGKR